MPLKVVIENALLRASPQGNGLQLVATVYIDGEEYPVLAPARATGDARDWADHLSVRTLSEAFGGEEVVTGPRASVIIRSVLDELEQQRSEANAPKSWGLKADSRYYVAQVCLCGHVINSNGQKDVRLGEHCESCGALLINSCRHCNQAIRGEDSHSHSQYTRPSFCWHCGQPYPWMEDRLQTARELLYADDKLTLEERENLWDLLQHVMSDPKSDLAPAKRKLIDIKLEKAAAMTRDFFVDFLAKYLAEMSKW